ncbi:uncharacterized protein LOC107630700 [Arachis ipaensis]|uniref:uncharacterized protein LOC107630700 n=1 Tax=Arachis ipaensis TaxID=130454 RepID=UPI0007AF4F4A|nr:uncharacterized protein LOC107630700 [Arachis ipaensis]
MVTMLNDAFGVAGPDLNEDGDGDEDNIEDGDGDNAANEEHNGENVEFYKLLEDGNEQLYEGCTKYSKLSFLVSLYHIKCLYRISDKAMTEILKLLKDAFGNAKISNTFYEANKTINKLGLNYTKIPACPNDCLPRIILTLCHLKMLFPPSFFTIMVHLTCHLVDEAKLRGPVHYRWMYPIERYLGHLKSYVRKKLNQKVL